MRGAPDSGQGRHKTAGIIPADAGSTSFDMRCVGSVKDHPRGCGEHETTCTTSPRVTGSSPRMRGAPDGDGDPDPTDRIIPADAGSTPSDGSSMSTAMDHPRGCGEHVLLAVVPID